MGTTVVRDEPGGAIYMAFFPVNGLVSVGTRIEVRGELIQRFGSAAGQEAVMQRADAHGTSAVAPHGTPLAGWEDTRIDAQQLWRGGPIGWLPRERLVDFARARAAGDDEAAAALLDPHEPVEPDAPKDTP